MYQKWRMKMYISTFKFNKLRLLRNMDEIHKIVMKMFNGNRSKENVLYVIMDSKSERSVNIIIQSDNKPQNIPDGFVLLNSKKCDDRIDSIKNGNIVRIYGTIEPTKRDRKQQLNKNSRQLLKLPEERKKWLQKKFSSAGELIAVNEVGKTNVSVIKKTGDAHKSSFFSYECLLYITDKDALKQLLRSGVGRSKAYGAGLFLILSVYDQ